jgi:hypothetical protein
MHCLSTNKERGCQPLHLPTPCSQDIRSPIRVFPLSLHGCPLTGWSPTLLRLFRLVILPSTIPIGLLHGLRHDLECQARRMRSSNNDGEKSSSWVQAALGHRQLRLRTLPCVSGEVV